MFLINNSPANSVLEPIINLMSEATPNEIESYVRSYFSEEWFDTTTASLRGNDNRLNHRIRSIRARLNITLWLVVVNEVIKLASFLLLTLQSIMLNQTDYYCLNTYNNCREYVEANGGIKNFDRYTQRVYKRGEQVANGKIDYW